MDEQLRLKYNEYMREYRNKNLEKRRKYNREWMKKNRLEKRLSRNANKNNIKL